MLNTLGTVCQEAIGHIKKAQVKKIEQHLCSLLTNRLLEGKKEEINYRSILGKKKRNLLKYITGK